MSAEFQPDRYYRPNDDALRTIASPGTLAQWRHFGNGPAYHKLNQGRGSRVLYSGADLLEWLQQKRIPVPGAAG